MNEQKTNNASVAVWIAAILTAWATLGFEAACIGAIGYVLQWAKALKEWRTDVAQAVVAVLCFGVYAAFHHPAAWPPAQAWLQEAAKWTIITMGIASIAGSTKGAPQTNTLGR